MRQKIATNGFNHPSMRKGSWPGSAVVTCLLALALVLLTAACGLLDDPGNDAENGNGEPEHPAEVEAWIENTRQVYAGHVLNHDGQTYILVSYGQQPTDGYDVTITDVTEGDEEILVTATFSEPAEDQDVAEGPTHPYDLHVMDETELPVLFQSDDEIGHVPTVFGLEQGEPLPTIVAGSQWIKVFTPAPNDSVGETFALEGMANVFEGHVSVEVVQEDAVLVETFVTGAMGDWAMFEEELILPEGTEGDVLLRLYSPDVSDGEAEEAVDGELFTVEIPLTVE